MDNFKQWLVKAEQTYDPAGDLVGDLKSDDELPNVESAEQLRSYLIRVGCCSGALEAMTPVWKRYQRWLRAGGGA